jgi:hypothetical protein
VRLSAQGLRNMDDGTEQIDDPKILAQVRRQARTVQLQTLVASTLLTLAFVILPV